MTNGRLLHVAADVAAEPVDLRRFNTPDHENARLKRIVAAEMLDVQLTAMAKETVEDRSRLSRKRTPAPVGKRGADASAGKNIRIRASRTRQRTGFEPSSPITSGIRLPSRPDPSRVPSPKTRSPMNVAPRSPSLAVARASAGARYASAVTARSCCASARTRRRVIRLVLVVLLTQCSLLLAACSQARPRWLALRQPIDPAQELKLPFGATSQYLQPWRAYLDTPPANRVADGLGVNFNVNADDAAATAGALERAGFHHARVEIGWDNIDPTRPTELAPGAAGRLRTVLSALFHHRLRPLILLNANDGGPTPTRAVTLHVNEPASTGSRQVVLDPATIAQVVPGRTGFDSLTGGNEAAKLIVTGITGSVATLSAPLPRALAPGNYPGATLAFPPFADPRSSLPAATGGFAVTLAGWLSYVKAVARFAREVGRGRGFDMEVWNELTFGSDFLNINNYYSPSIDPNAPASGPDDATDRALLAATASAIHHGFPGVQVGDGFSSQSPFMSGQAEVPGVQIDKHYYAGFKRYPRDVQTGLRPVDWLGRTFGTYSRVKGQDHWTDFFVPRYIVDFPEYYLTGIQTETLVRDLTPLRGENIYGTPHGRFTHPPGGPSPTVWMTEYNLDRGPGFTPAQTQRFQAKVVLRYLLAFINKGLGVVDFYSAEGSLGLLPDSFYASGEHRRASPGLTLEALGRMSEHIRAAPSMRRRSVTLLRISTTDHRTVFNGSGRYPPLRNIDVAAFFPFQEASHKFVFAAYVMTRNLTRAWQRTGPHEYDMPASPYRFVVGNVDGCRARLSAYDPIADRRVVVRRIACSAHTVTLQTELTDSPILIQATGA